MNLSNKFLEDTLAMPLLNTRPVLDATPTGVVVRHC